MIFLKEKQTFFGVLLCSLCFAAPFVYAEPIAVKNMSKSDEKVLREFFHALFWDSQCGYVLYGDKPICFEGYSEKQEKVFTIGHHIQNSMNEGFKVWEKYHLPKEAENFFLLRKEIKEADLTYWQVLFVNIAHFKKAVNDNLSLFRYVLGFDLTAEKLLQEIVDSKKDFLSILKDDRVLLGILLGFGTENALYISRKEKIDAAVFPKKRRFFFDPKGFFSNINTAAPPFKLVFLEPSFGFTSLEEEQKALEDRTVLCSPALEIYSPQLFFGHVAGSHFPLMDTYEAAQLKIIDILDRSDWFETLFSDLFGVPVTIQATDAVEEVPSDLAQAAAYFILEDFKSYFDGQQALADFSDFLEGMKEADMRKDAHYMAPLHLELADFYREKSTSFQMGFKIWSFYKFHDGYSLQQVMQQVHGLKDFCPDDIYFALKKSGLQRQIFENIDQYESTLACRQFESFKHRKDVTCLSENHLYYQQNVVGEGALIEKKQSVRASYKLRTYSGFLIDLQKDAILDLKRAIKGLREGLLGKRVGEKGILYIHPSWGIKDYHSPPHFSPYLIAEFEIHGIESGSI